MRPPTDFVVIYCRGLVCGRFLKVSRDTYNNFLKEKVLQDFVCEDCVNWFNFRVVLDNEGEK